MNEPSNFSRVSAASFGNVIMDAAPLVGGVPHQLPTSHYCPRRKRQHNPSWADWPNPGTKIRKYVAVVLRDIAVAVPVRYTRTRASPTRQEPQSFDQQHVDCHAELLLRRADDDAVDRRNVGKVAADREHDMVASDHKIVGRIEIDPAKLLPAPQRHPGMGSVGALQARLAR